jgi:hypothetical protein
MVTGVLDVTALVATAKVALVAPAATVTPAGTETDVLLLESDTCAPPPGAAADSVTVPVELLPPTTLAGLTPTDTSAAGPGVACGVKLRVDDHAPAVPAALRPRTRHQTRCPAVNVSSVTWDEVTVGFATNGDEIVDELSTWTS